MLEESKQLDVYEKLNALDRALDVLSSEVQALGDRLEPVMHPPTAQKTPSEGTPVQSVCQLSDRLYGLIERANALANRLVELRVCLEI